MHTEVKLSDEVGWTCGKTEQRWNMCIRRWDAEYKIDTKGTEVEEEDCRALSRDRVFVNIIDKIVFEIKQVILFLLCMLHLTAWAPFV